MTRWIAGFFAALPLSLAQAQDFDIQGWIDEQISSGGVLAATAFHVVDDEVSHYAGGKLVPGAGPTPGSVTQFEIGSLTKAFTNLLLAEMVASGEVTYDATVGDILGDELQFSNAAVADITLLQLATHSSGLPRLPGNLAPTDQLDPYKEYDESALLKGLAAARDKQPLGKHYAYSNFGVGLLGYLLGRAHGGGYRVALAEYVIEPLGLTNTGFERAEESAAAFRGGQIVKDWQFGALQGAGALRSTTTDLARFAKVQLGQTENPLSHSLVADREIVADAGAFDVTRVWHVGQSPDGEIFWHNGGTGGFWSFFGFRPGTSEAVAILVSGDPDPTGIGLKWLGFESPRSTTQEIDDAILGQYDLDQGVGIGVYAANGVLVAQVSGQMPLGLYRVDDDWYAMDVADASLHFLREGDRVIALELAQNGVLQRASKTADTAAALAKTAVELSRQALAEFVGNYRLNPSVKFTIRLGENNLEAMLTGQPFFPVFPKGDDKFFYKVVDAELHFERDSEGEVNAVVLHQGAIVERAEKVN
jgi:CubicO group peptidase (beta-lactamase class C family)